MGAVIAAIPAPVILKGACSRALTLDPASLKEALNDPRCDGQFDGLDLAATAKPLHHLSLVVIWGQHFVFAHPDAIFLARKSETGVTATSR
jgi:hypothetical protein